MTARRGSSEAFDDSRIRAFDASCAAAQDAARGVPAALLTEYETRQRAMERALREEIPALRTALEDARAVQKQMEAAHTEPERAVTRAPTATELAAGIPEYAGPTGPVVPIFCGVRSFELPYVGGHADPEFGTELGANQVVQGLVGWGDHSNPPPAMVNSGSGNGQLINGNLDLYWEATVPHDGIFAVNPRAWRSSFPVFGSHRVRGRGWYFSSNDARVEVHAWVIVYLDGAWLDARHEVVSWDATKSENRTKSFGAWIDLPGRITFDAQGGQHLGMIVRLSGQTWANDEGLAEINVDTFGIPSNVMDDMDLQVMN